MQLKKYHEIVQDQKSQLLDSLEISLQIAMDIS